jgi:hypothetical protein
MKTSLRQSIETYLYAKDSNRPHLMSHAFAADAELEMEVKTDEISFPSTVQGLAGISATLVSQFAERYENVYTFCVGTPPHDATAFRCSWLVCMTEKRSGLARVGFGIYDWVGEEVSGMVSKLKITIEEMKTLPAARGDSILDWARTLPYPWCPSDFLLRDAPKIPAVQEITARLAWRQ